MTQASDIELMLRVQQEDYGAFEELVQRYREPLRRFLTAILFDRANVEDAVQETFLRLWLSRKRYEPSGRFSTYLFGIARHHAWNQGKKLRREVTWLTEECDLHIAPPAATQPEAILLERYRSARIRLAIAALPVHYRQVVEMSHLQGLRGAEVAEQLGIPPGTVKSRLAEAVRRLRLVLSDLF